MRQNGVMRGSEEPHRLVGKGYIQRQILNSGVGGGSPTGGTPSKPSPPKADGGGGLTPKGDCIGSKVHVVGRDLDCEMWVSPLCSQPACGRCEPKRELKLVRAFRAHLKYHGGDNWHFVTMSTVNSMTLGGAFNLDAVAWRRFRDAITDSRRRGLKHVWNNVETWIGFREVTYSVTTGFNLHRHIFVLTKTQFWNWRELHERWDVACGRPSQLDVQPLLDQEMALKYVLKYAVKGKYWGGLTQLQAERFGAGLKGKNRLIRASKSAPPKADPRYFMCCSSPADYDECNAYGGPNDPKGFEG